MHATGYGRQTAELLHDRVAAAKDRDRLAPVTVVVPTNYGCVGAAAGRWLLELLV